MGAGRATGGWLGVGVVCTLLAMDLPAALAGGKGGAGAKMDIIEETLRGKADTGFLGGSFCRDVLCTNNTMCQEINSTCLVCGFDGRCHSEGTICNSRCRSDTECGGSCPGCVNTRCQPTAVPVPAPEPVSPFAPGSCPINQGHCNHDRDCSGIEDCTYCIVHGCYSPSSVCGTPCGGMNSQCGGDCPVCDQYNKCVPPPPGVPVMPRPVPVPLPPPPPVPRAPSVGYCPVRQGMCKYDSDCVGHFKCQFCIDHGCYSPTSICGGYCDGDHQCGGNCPVCTIKYGCVPFDPPA